MAKDPAFLFYPNDYIGGTMGMTFEEKGAYMEILMMQFNRGHMTEHMIRHVIGHLWDTIHHKFKQDTEGLWYNERLDIEKEKRKRYTDSRKNNKDGKNQHNKKTGHMTKHMTGHMENENENVIDYEFIIENYHSLCPKMSKVLALNSVRKGYINARYGEYGLDKIIQVLRMAGESKFLSGVNDKAWKADFEWIMKPQNFLKILEGKYKNNDSKQLMMP